MANILNSNKDGLALFDDGIQINETLTKWKNAKVSLTDTGRTFIVPQTMMSSETGTMPRVVDLGGMATTIGNGSITVINNAPTEGWGIDPESEEPEIGDSTEPKKKELSEIASMELREMNKYINDSGFIYTLTKTGRFSSRWENTTNDSPFVEWGHVGGSPSKLKFTDKLKLLFKKTEKPEMDVIAFFSRIKATSKESFNGYVDRIEKYLTAIHNAKMVGQEALVESLIREMIANRYEAFLAAEGYYHVVTEQQVVDFVNKTERGISIDYVKNFIRPIPKEVVDKIAEADKLEVFDNYVIMHYDPKGKNRQDTAKEEAKKRDPIVFGVIAGSTKLYYITDWIDEYCDLTLEKFVDTLGITKDDLVTDDEEKAKIESKRREEQAAKDAEAKKSKRVKKTSKKKETEAEEDKPKKARKTTKKKE